MKKMTELIADGNEEEVLRLLSTRSLSRDELNEVLFEVVHAGMRVAAERVVEIGADLNYRNPQTGWGVLHVAVETNQLGMVRVIAELGADLDLQDSTGMSPLHLAVDLAADSAEQRADELDTAVVAELVELGAHTDICDSSGATPTDWAKEADCAEIVSLIARRAQSENLIEQN